MGDPTPRCCKFAIKGLRDILEGEQGLHYDPRDGLNVVLSGPAGSGKTLLALQMAVTGAIESGMNVVYLSKDTPPETVPLRGAAASGLATTARSAPPGATTFHSCGRSSASVSRSRGSRWVSTRTSST